MNAIILQSTGMVARYIIRHSHCAADVTRPSVPGVAGGSRELETFGHTLEHFRNLRYNPHRTLYNYYRAMDISLGRVVILVKDYDKAFQFYQKNFNCKKIFDHTDESGQRFLHIGFGKNAPTGIWFLKSAGEKAGNQTNGEPVMVFYTNALKQLYTKLKANRVKIKNKPVLTPQYKFFHCFDLYGNEIVVAELGK